MENKSGLNSILYVFILVVIAVSLLTVVGDMVFENTNVYSITNETLLITPVRILNNSINDSLHLLPANTDWASITSIGMFNGTLFVLDTDYNVSETWGITFLNSTQMVFYNNNGTNLTYTWYPPEYVKSSTSRVVLGLIVLFVAIGLLLLVVAIIMNAFGYDLGIVNKLRGK